MDQKWKFQSFFFVFITTAEGLLAFETVHSFPTNDQKAQHCRDGKSGVGGGDEKNFIYFIFAVLPQVKSVCNRLRRAILTLYTHLLL